jgi:DNA polymerase (family 10)
LTAISVRDRAGFAALPYTLIQLAGLAEIRGEAYEATLLRRAAAAIEALGPDGGTEAAILARQGRLEEVPGIDAAIRGRVRDVAIAGRVAALQGALRTIPRDLARLVENAGLPPEGVTELHRRTGMTTAGDLAAAVDEGLLREGGGTPDLDHAARRALAAIRSGDARIPLGRAFGILEAVVAVLQDDCPEVSGIGPLGSLRRYEPTVGDIELIGVSERPASVVACLAGSRLVADVLHRGEQKASLRVQDEQVDLRLARPAEAPYLALHYTGSADHVVQLRRRAADRGLRLTSRTLLDMASGHPRICKTEEDIYRALGLPFVVPELRHGQGELEAAASGSLPRLVEQGDIRGDLHMHSDWSDGRDSIEAMVIAARNLGYDYVAISDHSPSAGASRVLTSDTLRRQMDEVARLRRKIRNIEILHAVEVDILPDGSLDFADEVLAPLDFVLASLHDQAGQTGDQLTERYVTAMRHPLVTIITHPTNRLVGRRAGYDLDFETLFDTAVTTGTLLEIDGAPLHLDMDGSTARRAIAAGATIVIDSDCHNAARLARQMHFGVATARRGWVEARHVLNCRPLADVRAWIARKHAAMGARSSAP